jgi:NitT/TauT family transport system ATP-binding protein
VPTAFPKCSPTEMMGLLVLLNSHKGSEDVALLADDLDLEIDEIFPALEFASVLQLVKVSEGRATFTDLGRKLVGGSIRDRKAIIRDQLRKTTLFKTLLRALESAPDHSLTDDDLAQFVSFTPTPADEAAQNIVNWGRYADLIRYDSAEHRMSLTRRAAPSKSASTPARPPSPPGMSPSSTPPPSKGTVSASSNAETRTAVVASA